MGGRGASSSNAKVNTEKQSEWARLIGVRAKLPQTFSWDKVMGVFDRGTLPSGREWSRVSTQKITKGLEMISRNNETVVEVDYGMYKRAKKKLQDLGFKIVGESETTPDMQKWNKVLLHIKK